MRVMKHELSRVIDKVKSIVDKAPSVPVLSGVLVRGNEVIASNSELTVRVKLESTGADSFVLPMRAFDMIKTLPEGEVEITRNEADVITISMQNIRNQYQSYPPHTFPVGEEDPDNEGVMLPGAQLMKALSNVVWASEDKSDNAMMRGVYIQVENGLLDIVATNGHTVAFDRIETAGIANMQVLVPKRAVQKLISMDMDDDVRLKFDKVRAVFETAEYSIATRLIESRYVPYQKAFDGAPVGRAVAVRSDMIAALTRARLCIMGKPHTTNPLLLKIEGDLMAMSTADATAMYSEVMQLTEEFPQTLRIGFDPRLMLEGVKAVSGETVTLNFVGEAAPVYISGETGSLRVLVLPVKTK